MGVLQMSETLFFQPRQTLCHAVQPDLRDLAGARQREAAINAGAAVEDTAVAGRDVPGTAGEIARHADHAQKFEHVRFAQQQSLVGMRWPRVAVVVQFDGFQHDFLGRGRQIHVRQDLRLGHPARAQGVLHAALGVRWKSTPIVQIGGGSHGNRIIWDAGADFAD